MSVKLVKDAAGMEKFVLKEPEGASAELYLNGGQVTSWKNAEGEEMLFMSNKVKFPSVPEKTCFLKKWFCPKKTEFNFKPPKDVRGGIPIGILEFSDISSQNHQGWARNRLWTVDPFPPPPPRNGTKAFVDLILNPRESDSYVKRHHNFEFRLRVALGAATLTVTSRVRNIGSERFKFTFALPTYFPVSDICEVRIEGLETLNYIDNLKNGTRFTDQGDTAIFEGEMDRFYLDTPTKIAIVDHEKRRTFTLRKHGCGDAGRAAFRVLLNIWFDKVKIGTLYITAFPSVVWNPWARKSRTIQDLEHGDYKKFVCVGAAVIDDPIKLYRGEEWKGQQEIRVVSSSYRSGQLILIKSSLRKQFLKKILCSCKFYRHPCSFGLDVLQVIQKAEKIPSQMFGALI